jgi:hypothetical protein
MKLFLVSFFLVLSLTSLSEARPRRSFFVPANDGNGCGYASCPAYNASAKVIILKILFHFRSARHKSTLAVAKYFHQILVNFEINQASNFVKEWIRWPPAGWDRWDPDKVKVGDAKLVRLSKVLVK